MTKKYQKYKRKYKRKYKKKKQWNSMGNPSGMPSIRVAKLRYVQKDAVTSTVGALGTVVYNANSIYAPRSSGGHQPMGHDTWKTMYNHYVVLGARISVRWSVDTSSQTTNNCMVGVMLNDDSTIGYSNYDGIMEARKGSSQMIHIQRGQKINSCNFSAKKFFNVKDVKDNLTRLGAATGASPTEFARFIVWAQSLDQSTTNTVDFVTTIDYIVSFSEPKELAQS